MSVGTDSPASHSQFLSSSHSSLNASKKTSNEISKTYKHASQLYLTRQLAEAYEVLQTVIQPPQGFASLDESTKVAPISTAATSQRIKIWSLYVTLLNAVLELGPDEGKADFGPKEYNSIVRLVQSGDIWGQVVQDGYAGREGNVDAEVVYNLSNLLLAQAPDQIVNQSRLETYLSSSAGELNFSEQLEQRLGDQRNGGRMHVNGAQTPKDLSSRIKILELFTLHVLPRNEEWEYAKSFINNSDVLDDERREAFLQTLQELQDAKENEHSMFTETETEDEFVDEPEVESRNPIESRNINGISSLLPPTRSESSQRRTSSEVDYGIDHDHPNGAAHKETHSPLHHDPSSHETTKLRSIDPAPMPEPTGSTPKSPIANRQPQSKPPHQSALRRPNNARPSKPKAKPIPATQSNTLITQARQILTLVSKISSNITHSLTKDSTALLRTLMFIAAFLVMLSRRDIRERVQRLLERAFNKVRSTIGMGVKVSYI